jgi:hypothetical protein
VLLWDRRIPSLRLTKGLLPSHSGISHLSVVPRECLLTWDTKRHIGVGATKSVEAGTRHGKIDSQTQMGVYDKGRRCVGIGGKSISKSVNMATLTLTSRSHSLYHSERVVQGGKVQSQGEDVQQPKRHIKHPSCILYCFAVPCRR